MVNIVGPVHLYCSTVVGSVCVPGSYTPPSFLRTSMKNLHGRTLSSLGGIFSKVLVSPTEEQYQDRSPYRKSWTGYERAISQSDSWIWDSGPLRCFRKQIKYSTLPHGLFDVHSSVSVMK